MQMHTRSGNHNRDSGEELEDFWNKRWFEDLTLLYAFLLGRTFLWTLYPSFCPKGQAPRRAFVELKRRQRRAL
jgi:hypothetical protein